MRKLKILRTKSHDGPHCQINAHHWHHRPSPASAMIPMPLVLIMVIFDFIIFGIEENTQGLEVCCSGFPKISHFLEQILIEHIGMINSLGAKLQIYSLSSIRVRSRKYDISEKLGAA